MAPKSAASKRKGPATPSPPTPLVLYKRALAAVKSWGPLCSETCDTEALTCLTACISQLQTRMGIQLRPQEETEVAASEAPATSTAANGTAQDSNVAGVPGAVVAAAAAAGQDGGISAGLAAALRQAEALVAAVGTGEDSKEEEEVDGCASSSGASPYVAVVRHSLDLDLEDWEEEPGFLLASAHLELGKLLGRMWPRRWRCERAHLRAALALFPACVAARLALAQALLARSDHPSDLQQAEGLLAGALSTAERLAGGSSGGAAGGEEEEAGGDVEVEEDGEEGPGEGGRRRSDGSEGSGCGFLVEANAACRAEWRAGEAVRRQLAMLACQAGREGRAAGHLRALGYTHRLARKVLHYPLDPLLLADTAAYPHATTPDPASPSPSPTPSAGPTPSPARYCAAVDGVLPAPLLAALRGALGPGGRFWREHGYGRVGYFSYMHELGSPALSAIHQAATLLHRLVSERFPAARGARFAEWWAHCRPHPSGHQLHFDSDDEGEGGVRNPFVSCVIYLTGGVGGPTLVTPQVLGGPLAPHGWLIYPRENRLGMFDATYLHGVLPGRGPSPRPGEFRITLMVAFWRDIQCRPRTDGLPGPSQPFPTSSPSPDSPPCRYSWMADLPPHPEGPEGWGPTAPVDAAPTFIDRVWERLDGQAVQPGAVQCYDECFQGF